MTQYSFVDTGPTGLVNSTTKISEGFQFGDFSSITEGWYMVTVTKDTPAEKEILGSVPYQQGVYDFSMLGDQRYFDNRQISYDVIIPNQDYTSRKFLEQDIKRRLMKYGVSRLDDTHDADYYWLGKCKSVKVTDTAPTNKLTATIIFDCYPFAIKSAEEGNDIWDDFNFETDIAQIVKHSVNNSSKVITLYNIGSNAVPVDLKVTGNISIKFGSRTWALTQSAKSLLTLPIGLNELTVTGTGTIEFVFHREEML